MGKIESKIGSTEFESGDFRTFQVEDASFSPEQRVPQQQHNNPAQYGQQMPAQQEMSPEEIMAARQRKIAEAGQVSDVARKRIEYLIGIGRAFRDVEVDANGQKVVFTIRTLKSKENENIIDLQAEASKAESVSGIFNARKKTIAYALHSIDGVNIDTVLGCSSYAPDEKIVIRESFIDDMDDSLVNYIFKHYEQLSAEHRKKFNVATTEEAEEVVDDIKKSS